MRFDSLRHSVTLFVLGLGLLLPPAAFAMPQDEVKPETIRLWETDAPHVIGDEPKDIPKLILYPANGDAKTDVAVVVFPGGGYGGLAMGHEGHQIAEWLNDHGISAFICDYRHRGKGYQHPAPMLDAQRAIQTVRSSAASYGISPDKIGVIGFSAGGHLASTVATHHQDADSASDDPVERVNSRPDFAILCYPVIAFDEPFTHRGSQINLLGKDPDADLVRKLSNEKSVTEKNPPTFLFHTTDDKAVPPENSIVFYMALRKAGVPAELHVFEPGRHGLGLAKQLPGVSAWSDHCLTWMRHHGWLDSSEK